jgi:beta-glucuronidase
MRRLILLTFAVLLCLPAVPAMAAGSLRDGLTTKSAYKNGPSSRFMMAGDWGFSRNKGGPYATVQVPYAWNANDNSFASYRGGIGFYRKDFALPGSKSSAWLVRFESNNYHSKVYLNGHLIGKHDGAYQPFELLLPKKYLKSRNRLLVRVDSRRTAADFPPYGTSVVGDPTGGWWNYSGILREVYLRKINKVDLSNVLVRPSVSCSKCKAGVLYKAFVKNYTSKKQKVKVSSRLGGKVVGLGSKTIKPHGSATLTRKITVAKPKLWSPASPYLYNTGFTLKDGSKTAQTYSLRSGLRSITVKGGRLKLNGQNLNIRGFGLHEDEPGKGFASDRAFQEGQIQAARNAGATMLRTHYPLSEYYYERADELGMFLWGEVPIYSVKSAELAKSKVRQRAVAQVSKLVKTKWNHPSLLIYSIGNELNSNVSGPVGEYVKEASAAVKALDPSRPIGLAINGYPGAGCQQGYKPLQVLGLNEYFGWYVGPDGQIADQSLLSDFLDQMRKCYPSKALMITEFGAEANRDGPREEKGSYQFQEDFINYHLNVFNSKPWLSGALYWALQEFKVRPNWDGGNPRPNSPLHEKGVIRYDGTLKPGYFDLQTQFRAIKQVGAP